MKCASLSEMLRMSDLIMEEERRAYLERRARQAKSWRALPGMGSNAVAAVELLLAGGLLAGGIYLLSTKGFSSQPEPPAAYQKTPSGRITGAKPDSEKRAEKGAGELPSKTTDTPKKTAEPVVPRPASEQKPAEPQITPKYESASELFSGLDQKIKDLYKKNKGTEANPDALVEAQRQHDELVESYLDNLLKKNRIRKWSRGPARTERRYEQTGDDKDLALLGKRIYHIDLLDGSRIESEFSIDITIQERSKSKNSGQGDMPANEAGELPDRTKQPADTEPRTPEMRGKTPERNEDSLEKTVHNPIDSRPYLEFVRVNFGKYSCRIPKSEADALAALQNKYGAFASTEKDEGDTHVDYIGFYGKHLEKVPDEVCRFTRLKFLNLDWNDITSLDDCLQKLPNLACLDARHNRLRTLDGLDKFRGQKLDITGNLIDYNDQSNKKALEDLERRGVKVSR